MTDCAANAGHRIGGCMQSIRRAAESPGRRLTTWRGVPPCRRVHSENIDASTGKKVALDPAPMPSVMMDADNVCRGSGSQSRADSRMRSAVGLRPPPHVPLHLASADRGSSERITLGQSLVSETRVPSSMNRMSLGGINDTTDSPAAHTLRARSSMRLRSACVAGQWPCFTAREMSLMRGVRSGQRS